MIFLPWNGACGPQFTVTGNVLQEKLQYLVYNTIAEYTCIKMLTTTGILWFLLCSKLCKASLEAGIQAMVVGRGVSLVWYSDGEVYCSMNGVVGTR